MKVKFVFELTNAIGDGKDYDSEVEIEFPTGYPLPRVGETISTAEFYECMGKEWFELYGDRKWRIKKNGIIWEYDAESKTLKPTYYLKNGKG